MKSQETIAQTTTAQIPEQKPNHDVRNKVLGFVGVAALVGIAGSYLYFNHEEKIGSAADPASVSAMEIANCNAVTFENVAANSLKYNSDAFLPKTKEIANPNEVRDYTNNLFGEKGPLACKELDKQSLAAVWATIVEPAQSGKTLKSNYDYEAEYQKALGRYNSAEGKTVAAQEARETYSVLTQTEGLSGQTEWAKGVKLTVVTPIRDPKTNEIIGMKLTHEVAEDNLIGNEFELRTTNKDLQYFNQVLVTADGKMRLKGFVTIPETNGDQKSNATGQASSTSVSQTASGISAKSTSSSTGGSAGVNGNGASGNGNATAGNTAQNLQVGINEGEGQGNSGTTNPNASQQAPASTSSTGNSGNNGSGSTGGETPTSGPAPIEAPTSAPASTNTPVQPTSAPQPTQPPAPTSQPIKPPKTECDPNVGDVCPTPVSYNFNFDTRETIITGLYI